LACSSDLGPNSPRIVLSQQVAAGPEIPASAVVEGRFVVAQGRYAFEGCRHLKGTLEENPGALLLNVIATRPQGYCSQNVGLYDYEVRLGPLPPGSYQLTVVERNEERLHTPAPIALRVELRVD
jgi:hypothetical protein